VLLAVSPATAMAGVTEDATRTAAMALIPTKAAIPPAAPER
jgi:hypothetical protein